MRTGLLRMFVKSGSKIKTLIKEFDYPVLAPV